MKLKKILEENSKLIAVNLTLLAVLVLAIFLTNQNDNPMPEKQQITDSSIIEVIHINSGKSLLLETASTPQKRQQGLMLKESLDSNSGMIFIFNKEDYLSFWMKDTSISLDMIFLDNSLKVTTIHRNTKPNQTNEIYAANAPSSIVIETLAGWTISSNVKVGDEFRVVGIK